MRMIFIFIWHHFTELPLVSSEFAQFAKMFHIGARNQGIIAISETGESG